MNAYAQAIWSGLEFRKPMILRNVEPLTGEQLHWPPGAGRNSIAWQLWHIAEVEDNWIRSLVTGEPLRFPFGVQVRQAGKDDYPSKTQLLEYLAEVRGMSRERLEASDEAEFTREVNDPDFGPMSVLDIWSGVVTSYAWHGGQIAQLAKLMPDSPVTPLKFEYWKPEGG